MPIRANLVSDGLWLSPNNSIGRRCLGQLLYNTKLMLAHSGLAVRKLELGFFWEIYTLNLFELIY